MLRHRLDLWRNASVENEEAWREVERLQPIGQSSRSKALVRTGAVSSAERRAASNEKPHVEPARPAVKARERRARPRWMMAGAGVALAAMLAFLWVPVVLVNLQADHVTSTAELRTITLEDGSTVTLAAASAIAVSLDGRPSGQVKLLRGEAFFQVTKRRAASVQGDRQRGAGDGRGHGVRRPQRAAGDVTVDVCRRHRRRRQGRGRRMASAVGAGQTISIASNGKPRQGTLPTEFVAAWRQGRLLTAEVPLARCRRAAPALLQRHHRPDRRCARATGPITGAYTLSEPEEARSAPSRKAHGATVRRVTPWLLVISPS